jgi:hypothetical protein
MTGRDDHRCRQSGLGDEALQILEGFELRSVLRRLVGDGDADIQIKEENLAAAHVLLEAD